MKYIAFHLPQYHTFPENDKWWGEGFTEWTNVKKAKPLFKGHNQPKIPLDNNYYNMLDQETWAWQAKLAKDYGLYGFCYYHYWFDGKLLMERPLEGLLNTRKIDFPFCLCWANEPWTRAWDGKTSSILMPQRYGGEKEWYEHIQYLMPFFKDSRYIKVDGKPMFLLYRTESIENCDLMIQFWNKECKKNGFPGIWIVEELNGFQSSPKCKQSSAIVEFQPNYIQKTKAKIEHRIDKARSKVFSLINGIHGDFKTFDYDDVWNRIIQHKSRDFGKKLYLGAFVNWDNSPRKGMNASVFRGGTPEKFQNYLSCLSDKAIRENREFIFINAWNEWAEGAYLEPDEENRYAYLEAIKNIKNKVKTI